MTNPSASVPPPTQQAQPQVGSASGDVFLCNLAALWSADPELAMALDELDDSDRVAVEPSRAGPPTARLAGQDGIARYLHSRYDPVREAAALVDAHIRQDALCYVILGCGLGYAAAQFLTRLPEDAAVVVVEPNLALLATALELHDFSQDIRSGRLAFLTRAEAGHLHSRLTPHSLRILAGTRLVSSPAMEQLAGGFFSQARQSVADFVAYSRVGLLTLLLNNERTARNVCYNLGHYLAAPSVGRLRNRLAGFPAVVVSAGPSLAGTLAMLKELASRVVIIAVQTTLRPLLEAGIRPHFVTSLDYHEIGQRFYQDLPADELAQVHLVAEPKAHWRVIDTFASAAAGHRPAMISLLGNDFAETLLAEDAPGNDKLPAGATVAHLAFYLAQHLGCDPIVFIGQDLGFSNGSYYTPGTAIHRVWAGELNRFNSLESMEWQRIARDRRTLRRLTDVHGRPIYTDEQMFTYLQQFQRDFATAPQRVIDATGGGVAKAGAEVMELAEVGRRFATRPLPSDGLDYRGQARWFDPARLAGGIAALRRRLDQVEQLQAICRRTLELLARLADLLEKDPAGFNRTLVEVDELRMWVQQHGDIHNLVSQVSQLAEFQKFTADRSLRIRGAEGVEKRKFQLARDRAYVQALQDGCDRLADILSGALERLQGQAEARPGKVGPGE